MEKRVNIGMKILPTLLEAIDRAADQDGRSRSNMIEFIATDWFRKNRPDLLPEELRKPAK